MYFFQIVSFFAKLRVVDFERIFCCAGYENLG